MQLQRFWFVISILTILVIGCGKTEYIEVPVIQEELIIMKIDSSGYYGASGLVNDEFKEFLVSYFYIDNNTEMVSLVLGNLVWFGNTTWAARNVISITNIDPSFNVGDTVYIDGQELMGRLYHQYGDGHTGAECYDINDEGKSQSWILINE